MEIHEITKRHRTDEGILDKVKSAVNSAKTGYNAVSNKYNAVKDKFNAAGDKWQEKQWDKRQDKINQQAGDAAKVLARKGFNVDTTTPLAKAQTPTRVKQQQQQKIAQLQQAFDQEFDLKGGGQGPVATDNDEGGIKVQIQQPGTTSPTTYTKDSTGVWTDETGQKITNPKSVAMLNAKADNPKGVQVNPAAVPPVKPVQPAAKSYSPEDVLIPGSNYDTGKPPPPGFEQVDLIEPGKKPQTRFVHKSQTQSWLNNGWTKGAGDGSVAFSNKSGAVQSNNPALKTPQVKEGALAQRSQARNARAPAQAPAKPPGKKDIQKEFMSWISQHIPGIENVSPQIKQQLNQTFKAMVAAKGNPKAIDQAFQQYASIALSAVSRNPQGQQQGQPGISPSAQYAQQAIAGQLGISPDAIAKLQQRMAQNQEQIQNAHTGSKTIDTLIQAVAKK
jgi:hypothetical protein